MSAREHNAAERPARPATAARFCAQCGAALPGGARFCPACGGAVGAAAETAPPRSLREQAPGLVVLAVFLAVGLGIWVSVLGPGAPVSGPPRGPGAGATGAGSGLPADHPPVGLPEEAKQLLAQLTSKAEAAPADAGAWRNLAQVQARAAQLDPSLGPKAIASYRHLLELAPGDAEALRSLGNLHYDQEQYAEAAEQYERYLRDHPDDPGARTDLATTYLYQRQVDRAIDAYKAVIASHPDFLQAYFNLGLAYEAKGERDQALAAIGRARDLATDEGTRTRIDRVVAQLKGEAPGAGFPGAPPAPAAVAQAPGGAGGGAPAAPPGGRGGAAAAAGAGEGPRAADYRGEIEAGLRAHAILGPKITAIEWPAPERARAVVAEFPMQAMPELARNLFRARLETIIHDAKEAHGVTGERSIEIVDAASGEVMERVAH